MEPPTSTPHRIEDLLTHVGWVRGLARHLVGDEHLADELVQDAYVAALERPPSSEVPPRAWLAGVLRNLARMRWRGDARRARREQAAARADPLDVSTAGAVQRIETQRMLADAVLGLGEPYRTTIVLRFLDGLSSADIARRQGVPAATVRSRLKRGLALLRGDLDRRHGGERRAWLAALAPFLGGPGAPPVDAAAARPESGLPLLLQGMIAMNGTTKLASAAALLLALAAAAWFFELLPGSEDRTADVARRPLRTEDGDASAKLRGRTVAIDTSRIADREPRDLNPAETPGTGSGTATIVMRFVDERGLGLSGVQLVRQSGEPLVGAPISDATGALSLSVRATSGPGVYRWHATRSGCATALVEVAPRADETTLLGELVLEPGGELAGVVVHADGRPASGARVHATPPDLPASARARAPLLGAFEPELPFAVDADAGGCFRLTGLPVGRVRVWATAEGTRHAFSSPVEVRADHMAEGIRLVLEPRRPEDTVEGVVLLPSGAPAEHARIRYVIRRRGGMRSATSAADQSGRFTVCVPRGGRLEIAASSQDGALNAPSVQDLRPGARGVTLELRRPRRVTIRVRSADAPLERFEVNVLTDARAGSSTWSGEGPHARGEVELEIPFGVFHLAVEAPGYDRVIDGPYDAAAAPTVITVVLERVPGLTGRVLAKGEPVAGAQVRLHREAPADVVIEHNQFPVRVDPQAVARATTDEHGRFRLDVRAGGRYRLRAWADGFAAAEQRDLELEPMVLPGERTLRLTVGGAIEGRVRRPDGAPSAGAIVSVSRGDGYARTIRADAEGRYRFECLTPGPWEVRGLAQEILPGSGSTSMTTGPEAPPLPHACRVVEGGVTRHDLGGDPPPFARLEGRVRLGDASPAGWNAVLRRAGSVAERATAETRLDEAGRFTLEVMEAGRYVLSISAAGESDGGATIVAFLELNGGTSRWSLDLATGALRGSIRRPSLEVGERFLHLWWDGADTYVLTPCLTDEAGAFALKRVPAGAGRLIHLDRRTMALASSEARPRPETWPVLTRCEVGEGETQEITVD